jgi:undecaprenyl-diphosphatase
VRSSTLLGVVLAVSLVAYAVIAADVVNGGRLSSFDETLSSWVARSMPTWAEWLARPFSWVGGVVGVTLVVAAAVVWLVRRREPHLGALVIVVALGAQVLTTLAKNGFDRPRPTAGSPIDVPSSFSFPSGHALSGIAVFGLLGLIAARELPAHARRTAVAAGFALGGLIGASRIVLDVHFLSDVLAGAALGLAWLAACLLAVTLVPGWRRRYADRS